MRNVFLASALAFVGLTGCAAAASDNAATTTDEVASVPNQTLDQAPLGASSPTTSASSADGRPAADGTTANAPTDPEANPGAKPASACSVSKDSNGFFTRSSGGASYVGYVPPTYDGSKPMRLVVGMHGCGDSAYNFATWGVAPWDTRKTQTHIAVSLDGASGNGSCWVAGDEAKVLAAIEDISSCYWVHQHKVVLAGFSSGGELAYRVALKNAAKVSGILVEDSAAYGWSDEAALLAGASRKVPIAHRAHQNDSVFPISSVQGDWTKIKNAGFPLVTSVVAGTHDGTSEDWNNWLFPQMASWISP